MECSESRQETCCGDQCPSKIEVEKLKDQIENLNKLIKYLENDIKRQEQVIESLHKVQNDKNQFTNDVAPQDEGFDFGTGAAHSFFHGYLKIVIPRSGTSHDKHLKELMQDYEDTHKIKFEFYKLFVLVPNSLYCPTSLNEVSPASICDSASLEEKKITVAGVKDRSYKNSVYKIKSNEKFIYAVVEYATPIKTFRDALNYQGRHSDEERKTKDKVLDRFCSTLQKLLKENEDCTDYCEIIRYDDEDKNGERKDLATILLTRFEELRGRKMA